MCCKPPPIAGTIADEVPHVVPTMLLSVPPQVSGTFFCGAQGT